MEILLKLCSIALVGVIALGILKRSLPEMSVVLSVTVLIAIALLSYEVLRNFFEFISDMVAGTYISETMLFPLVKTAGISIISKLACDICREGGLISVASYIEVISGVLALSFSFPLIERLLGQFLG